MLNNAIDAKNNTLIGAGEVRKLASQRLGRPLAGHLDVNDAKLEPSGLNQT